ncbi:MAG: hypothetical protein O3B46_05835 [Bacteroidetes bacterium]|nr:hypothetical protein [Bacteroidota bacterium]MDA0922703.1 hypothetical protein [Bacteroidota bacterium]MDA1288940.1 hypothetical protein [Bacteroidota bacterium]
MKTTYVIGLDFGTDSVRAILMNSHNGAVVETAVHYYKRWKSLPFCQPIENKLPNLPVARVLWTPQPSLEIAASAWMKAGGAHHTVYTQALDTEVIQDFATLAGVELICIDKNTKLFTFEQNLNANDTAY